MDDLRFKAINDHQKEISPVAVAYFEAMLPKWKDDTLVETTFKEVLAQFNCENAGIYRRTCIVLSEHNPLWFFSHDLRHRIGTNTSLIGTD